MSQMPVDLGRNSLALDFSRVMGFSNLLSGKCGVLVFSILGRYTRVPLCLMYALCAECLSDVYSPYENRWIVFWMLVATN